jgi:hypothetical protein
MQADNSVSAVDAPAQQITVPQNVGDVSIKMQLEEVDALLALAAGEVHHIFPPHRPSSTRNDAPNRNRAIEQQDGGIAAEYEFATRVTRVCGSGHLTAMTTIAAGMYEEVKDAYFPADKESFLWPRKTPMQIGFAERTHQFTEMGDKELGELYYRLLGAN